MTDSSEMEGVIALSSSKVWAFGFTVAPVISPHVPAGLKSPSLPVFFPISCSLCAPSLSPSSVRLPSLRL
ncbi:hypothetical protein DM860_002113 [Cuscuta australis]|uniref:Uncharacterized protein n=1 Tax=Cuscuta australis TaxID=267555 RepID=A0A328DVV8_9ASTE|nr:hypothetical protein DM860_002113 [Cuscuta australis]